MNFVSAAHTDVGTRKSVNQDAVLIEEAVTDRGGVLLAVICDGMGGLARGEAASSALIRAFSRWFEETLPFLIYREDPEPGIPFVKITESWQDTFDRVNRRIEEYSMILGASCGTTAAALLLAEGRYYIGNVGDSRVYRMNPGIRQLTKDQTFVQREMDEGRMSAEQARVSPQRNVLLQCVGASPVITPEFLQGQYGPDELFLLCSDGFRHVISEDEIQKILAPGERKDEQTLRDAAVYCTELCKQRGETDNISSILIQTL